MSWDYSRHYQRFHADNAGHDRTLRELYRRWLGAHLPADKHAAILDVGCGRGYALEWLRELGYTNLSGIETDPGQAAYARGRGLPVQWVADSTADLRGRAGSCDLVLLMDVIEHVPGGADRALLEAIAGALRPGGILVATTPNADAPLANHWRYVDYTHQTSFTPASLEFLFSHAGLKLNVVAPLEFCPPPRFLIWPPTKRTLRWWFMQLGRLQPRLACIGEFGWQEGRRIALAPNLLAVATRS